MEAGDFVCLICFGKCVCNLFIDTSSSLNPFVSCRSQAEVVSFVDGRAVGKLIGLEAILIGYAVINLALVGGQKLSHQGEQAQLDEIKVGLNSENLKIKQIELQLQKMRHQLKESSSKIKNLKSRVELFEQSYPQGVPANIYNGYSRSVAEYNARIGFYNATLAQYDVLYADYSKQVEHYNGRVAEANVLAQKIGTTYYLLPVPGHAGSHSIGKVGTN